MGFLRITKVLAILAFIALPPLTQAQDFISMEGQVAYKIEVKKNGTVKSEGYLERLVNYSYDYATPALKLRLILSREPYLKSNYNFRGYSGASQSVGVLEPRTFTTDLFLSGRRRLAGGRYQVVLLVTDEVNDIWAAYNFKQKARIKRH